MLALLQQTCSRAVARRCRFILAIHTLASQATLNPVEAHALSDAMHVEFERVHCNHSHSPSGQIHAHMTQRTPNLQNEE